MLDSIIKITVASALALSVTGCVSSSDNSKVSIVSESPQPEITPPSTPTEPTTDELVNKAVDTGNAFEVLNSEVLLDAALDSIIEGKALLLSAKAQILNLNTDGSTKSDGSSLDNITWNPTHDAATFTSIYGVNTPVLKTNSTFLDGYTTYEKEVGIIGQLASGSSVGRYMVLGSNPLRNIYRDSSAYNDQMHDFLINSVEWLTARTNLNVAPFHVVVAQMDSSQYFPDETAVRSWLDTHYAGQVNYNAAGVCDDLKLAACLKGKPDLLIISRDMNDISNADLIASTVESAMLRGTPVLYLHLDGGTNDLGDALYTVFNVRYEWDNYWKKLSLNAFNAAAAVQVVPKPVQSIQTVLTHLKAADYSFDWSQCDGENCSAVDGLASEFTDGADALRNMMGQLDTNKDNIFSKSGYRFQKLLALLGDHYRSAVTFPMDKTTTNDTVFLKSYFADHAVYNYRTINPAQADMGNFSRSDFSHVTPSNKTIKLTSKRNFRAAGVYALPGQTVTVKRNDNSEVGVKVFINSLRSGSTHQWAENGYSRPKYLKSAEFDIATGETIRFTSPYGGPIQVAFDTNDLDVELAFENIGEHAIWRGIADDASFTSKLAAAEYDWAELVTPSFEVHSTLEKMRISVADDRWGSAKALAAATTRYVHNYPHVLAGFKGEGVDVIDEIHDFSTSNGLTIDDLDLVKHMNADQATCGYGCSGNPYDAYWSFSPIGHGDIHELGHGLEHSRLRFNNWQTHTSTNPYSYYTKTQYYKDTNADPTCQSLPFETMFNVLKASISEPDPAAHVKAELWDKMGWSEGAAFFVQMMMSAQGNGALKDGWHLLARLHIIQREFDRAINSDDMTWNAKRQQLGFGMFSRAEAKNLDQNDWLLISISFATRYDFRNYFDQWAMSYSGSASMQVASLSLPVMPTHFYVSSSNGYCKGEGFDGSRVIIEEGQTWPLSD